MFGEIPTYGPGTTNKIIPWFTATKAPYNYALPQYLGDRLTWNTWGGENQPVTFPMGKSNLEYSLAQDYNNPNHIRQWNPLLIGYHLGEDNTTDPIAVAQGNMNAYQWGYNMVQTQQINQKIATIAQALGSLEGRLTNILKSDKLTESQRRTLQTILEKVQAKKEEIQKKLQTKPSIEDIEAIQGEVLDIQKETSEKVEEIINEIQGKTSTDSTSNTTSSDDDTTTISAEDAAKKADAKQKKDLTAALDICKDIYAGSIGHTWGTDYDTIRKGTAKINKDNAATVILAWDQQHKASSGKSLVKALFDEEHLWNPSLQKRGADNKVDNSKAKNIDMIWNIVASLEEKAKELDIYNELAGQFTVAYDELDDTCVDQEAVENAVDAIAKKVYEAQSEKAVENAQKDLKAEADKKAKTEKAKKDEENLKAEQQAWTNFTTDMKEIFGDDKLNVSDKVEYKDGKFQIRILGDVFEGKTFKELAKAIKDAGLDPKEYLVEKQLDVAC